MYGGKFVFQNRLGRPYSWKEIYRFCFVLLYKIEGNFHVQAPGGLVFGGAISRRASCVMSLGGLYLEGLIHGGAYFRNFTVCNCVILYAWWWWSASENFFLQYHYHCSIKGDKYHV